MSYGHIQRGPMGGDAFTQIRNTVFRDPRLSAKAMGIFGNISTHRDGWGITPESLSTQMSDGVGAIKSGLRELEEHGYLRRTQTKRPDGKFGAAVYYITDQPELVDSSEEEENRRSEPSVEIPPTENPPAVQPLADDHPHKKTNSKHTNFEKHSLSSPAPTGPLEPAAAPAEREIDPLVQKLMTDHGATKEEAAAILAQVRAERRIGNLAGWASSATGGLDIEQRLYALRAASRARERPAGPRPSMVTADTDGRDTECEECGRVVRAGTPDGLCRDCREDLLQVG